MSAKIDLNRGKVIATHAERGFQVADDRGIIARAELPVAVYLETSAGTLKGDLVIDGRYVYARFAIEAECTSEGKACGVWADGAQLGFPHTARKLIAGDTVKVALALSVWGVPR